MHTLKQVTSIMSNIDNFSEDAIKIIRYARSLRVSPQVVTLLLNKINISEPNNVAKVYDYINLLHNAKSNEEVDVIKQCITSNKSLNNILIKGELQ